MFVVKDYCTRVLLGTLFPCRNCLNLNFRFKLRGYEKTSWKFQLDFKLYSRITWHTWKPWILSFSFLCLFFSCAIIVWHDFPASFFSVHFFSRFWRAFFFIANLNCLSQVLVATPWVDFFSFLFSLQSPLSHNRGKIIVGKI